MKLIRITAKAPVTQYGSWTRGQTVPVTDEFALHMIQNGLAVEVNPIEQPAPFNKMFTPAINPEKKVTQSNTGELNQSGVGTQSASLGVDLDLTQRPRKPFAGRK